MAEYSHSVEVTLDVMFFYCDAPEATSTLFPTMRCVKRYIPFRILVNHDIYFNPSDEVCTPLPRPYSTYEASKVWCNAVMSESVRKARHGIDGPHRRCAQSHNASLHPPHRAFRCSTHPGGAALPLLRLRIALLEYRQRLDPNLTDILMGIGGTARDGRPRLGTAQHRNHR